jgi:hypothetical protein
VIAALLVLPLLALAGALASFHLRFVRPVQGTRYFGLTSQGRRELGERIRRRGRFVHALARFLAARRPLPEPFGGLRLPGETARPLQCRRSDFRRAMRYRAEACDVFVVTQMKCGTTWMQQLVYETILRGHGDLGDDGQRHIYAVSPWIESSWAVSMESAPRLGERGLRVIKSHMPVKLLPVGERAHYIYVTRHPVACFASCADFIGMMAGPLTSSREKLLEWFCSDRMWWSPWPDHVDGWWRASQVHPNVLFVHFEEMLADLPATVDRVAGFLGVSLTAEERAEVVRKSGFDFMKRHEERFSMAPPTPFSVAGEFLRSGKADRDADVLARERETIVAFCRERLRGAAYPAARFYPDIAP